MQRCGGTSQIAEADETVQTLINKIRPHAEEKSGANFGEYKAISVTKQIVNGINYFVKVHIGGDIYIHLRVHESFDSDKEPQLSGILLNKSKDDELSYFDPQ